MNKLKLFLKNNTRALLFSIIFGILYTICFFAGTALDNIGTIWVRYKLNNLFILLFISFLLFFIFLKLLPKIKLLVNLFNKKNSITEFFFAGNTKSFWICFVFITICHLPVFLAYFPGIFSYDTIFQIQFFFQPEHIEVHPTLHSILLFLSYLIYLFTKSSITAVLTYTIFQSILVNLIFAYCITSISKLTDSLILRIFALLFFAVYPLNMVFPLVATKDVLFSAVILMFILLYIECRQNKNNTTYIGKKDVLFALIIIISMLLRHNFLHAYILLLPFIFFDLRNNKQQLIKFSVILLVPFIFLLGFNSAKKIFGIKPAPIASSIGIPLQQMGRVRILENKNLDSEDKLLFKKLISPKNELAYNPLTADNMKENEENEQIQYSLYLQQSIKNHPKEFVNLYFKWLKLYPKDYIDAFLLTNYHYWYVVGKSSNVVYKTNRIAYTYLMTAPFIINNIYGMNIEIKSYLPALQLLLDDFFQYNGYETNPITFLIFSFGCNTWFLFTGLLLLLYQKKYNLLCPLLIYAFLFITVLFGPGALMRYVYQNFLIIPLLLTFCFGEIKQITKD